MRRWASTIGVLGLCLSSAGPVASQGRGGGHAPSGVVVGRVVELDNAGSHRPLEGATVTLSRRLSREDAPDPAEVEWSTQTTNLGRYLFSDVPPGKYDLQASLGGYAGGRYGQTGPLVDGGTAFLAGVLQVDPSQPAPDIRLVLWKNGTLTGTILDEVGEPVVAGVVRAVPVADGLVRRSLGGGRTTRSDDRGRYQFTLRPGSYLVAVEGPLTTMPASVIEKDPGGAGPRSEAASRAARQAALERSANGAPWVGRSTGIPLEGMVVFGGESLPPRVTADGRVISYPTTFYPGATLSSSAQVVPIGPGQDRTGVDIQVIPQATSQVSGTVFDPAGRPLPGVGVRLVNAAWRDLSSPTLDVNSIQGLTDDEGRFVLYGVAAGSYLVRVLKVPVDLFLSTELFLVGQMGRRVPSELMVHPPLEQPTFWSAQPVSVGEGDVHDVAVVLQEGIRVSGRLVSAGPALEDEALSRIAITFTAAPGSTAALYQIRHLGRFVDAERFMTQQLVPGPYFISVSGLPSGWTVRSVMVPGVSLDASDSAVGLTGADVEGVVVTVTNQAPPRVHGDVRSTDGRPVPHASVVAFPTDSALWAHPELSRRIRVLRSDNAGEFETDALPAGSYYLAAATEPLGQVLSREVLQRLRPDAVSATVPDSGDTAVRLIRGSRVP